MQGDIAPWEAADSSGPTLKTKTTIQRLNDANVQSWPLADAHLSPFIRACSFTSRIIQDFFMNTQSTSGPTRESHFFVIDSRNLEAVHTCLYGFAFHRQQVAQSGDELGGETPNGNGAYIWVRRSADTIEIRQDSVGCYGLYLYRYGSYYAISNSFFILVEHVKREHPISLNINYARTLLVADLCPVTVSETMIQEIETIDRSGVLSISLESKDLSITYHDYEEGTVSMDSPEGLRILDQWFDRWAGLIRHMALRNLPIQVSLSGGYDTRMVLAMLLGSGFDMRTAFVYSMQGDVHTLKEDYEIASQIASHYGFELNNRKLLRNCSERPLSTNAIINNSYFTKYCLHKQMYYRRLRADPNLCVLSGNGGECIRLYLEKDFPGNIHVLLNRCRNLPEQQVAVFTESIRRVYERALTDIEQKYAFLGRDIEPLDRVNRLYRETRCRIHYGRSIVEAFCGGHITYSPLLDPDLLRIKSRTHHCDDDHLLMVLLFTRYQPRLLKFKVEGGRSFKQSTIEAAHKINESYPRQAGSKSDVATPLPFLERREQDQQPVARKGNQSVASMDALNQLIAEAFLSCEVKSMFGAAFGDDIYDYIASDVRDRTFFPLEGAHAVLSISMILQSIGSGAHESPVTPTEYLANLIYTTKQHKP